jgi:hypothetical protein
MAWVVVTAVVVVASAWLASRQLLPANELPPGLIQVSGRIEGDTTTIASKQPGRLRAWRYARATP